jgi:uncharacterized repeat protein (TIGR01451 family)
MTSFAKPPIRFSFFFAFIFGLANSVSGQFWNWSAVEQLTTGATCTPQAMVADPLGNVYVTGSFSGTVTIGATVHTALGNGDMYLVKYNSSGTPLWSTRFGASTTYNEQVFTIAADTSGNVYVGGGAMDPFTIGSVAVSPSIARGFVLKFDGSGNCIWSKMLGSPGASPNYPQKIIFDKPNNRLLVGGMYWQSGVFDAISLTGSGAQDTYLASLDPANGAVLFAKNVTRTTGTDAITGLATDATGNIFLCGGFGSSTNILIGNQTFNLPNAGSFIAKFRNDGVYVNCFTSIYMTIEDLGYSTSSGNIYSSGQYFQAFTQGNISLPYLSTSTGADAFFCAFDTLLLPLYNTTANGPGNDAVYEMLVDSHSIYITMRARDQMVCQSNMLNNGGQDYSMVYMKLDDGLTYIWSNTITGTHFSNRLTGLAKGNGQLYMCGAFNGSIYVNNPAPLSLSSPLNKTSFLVSLHDIQSTETGRIKGWVFLDNNANGIIDTAENVIFPSSLVINQTDLTYSTTDSYGHYFYSVSPGTKQLDLLTVPFYYSQAFPAAQQPAFVSVLPFATRDSINFGLQAIPGIRDLEVFLTAMSPVRPGRDAYYYLDYKNWGTDTMTGHVKLHLDTHLTFSQSVPAPDSINGEDVYYGFSNLLLRESRHINITCVVDSTSQVNANVHNFAVIEPVIGDSTPINNYDTLHQVIVQAYDPNIKEVYPAGAITPTDVSSGIDLEYIIHFQNTGNDTAFDVVIRDTLSNLLDISTFQLLSSSAPVTFTYASSRELVFTFSNILLPDSTTDEAGSHGFVRYRISPVSSAMAGQTIYNTSYIFFDYNLPIKTNITGTPIQVLTSNENEMRESNILVYPNPFSSQFNIEIRDGKIVSVKAYDVVGRELATKTVYGDTTASVELINEYKGIVLIEITTEDGIKYVKLIRN